MAFLGALIGAGVGAAAGVAIGSEATKRQQAELLAQRSNVVERPAGYVSLNLMRAVLANTAYVLSTLSESK